MFKCDNCEEPAEYQNSTVEANNQSFCKKHVPWTLRTRLREGSLPKISAQEEIIETVEDSEVVSKPKAKAKKKSEPVVEPEPVVEESPVVEELPVVEEAPVEEV